MKKICFIFTNGRKSRRQAVEKGESPPDFFYGALELEKRGYTVEILEDDDIPRLGRGRFPASVIQKFFNLLGVGLDIGLFLRMKNRSFLRRLDDFDAVVAATNSHGMILALLKAVGKLKSRVIFFSMCPLFPDDGFLKTIVYKKLLRKLTVSVENKHELDFLKKLIPDIKDELFYIPFGVDPDFWKPLSAPNNPGDEYVLSMGNDSMRDYATLLGSWKLEYPPLKIITRLPILGPIPSNIELIRGDWKQQYLSDIQIREYIRRSLFVIIPTKESLRSSGPSVCMESMGCEKAVIISKTQGLWDEEAMRDGFNCLLPMPYSVEDLREKIETLLGDSNFRVMIGKNARKTLEEHFTVRHLADRLEKVINKTIPTQS